MSSAFEPKPLPPPAKPGVSVALSLLMPGLGLVYAAAPGLAALFLLANVLVSDAWPLVAAFTHMNMKTYSIEFWVLRVGLRLLAAVFGVVWLKVGKTRRATPMGAYGLFVLGWLLLRTLAVSQMEKFVSPYRLSADGMDLRAGEYLMSSKLGSDGTPAVGTLAVYLADKPDASVSPVQAAPRDAFVGRVIAVGANDFQVDGADASVALTDYAGFPLGILLMEPWSADSWARAGELPR